MKRALLTTIYSELFIFQVKHNNQTWNDVCFRVPIVSKPKCLDPDSLQYLTLLGKKRRKRDLSDRKRMKREFSEDEWFNDDDDESDFLSESRDEECKNFTIPKFTSQQLASLGPLAQKYKKEGFSLEVGEYRIVSF